MPCEWESIRGDVKPTMLQEGEELGVVMSILEGGIDGTEVTSKEGEFVKPVIGELVGALEE